MEFYKMRKNLKYLLAFLSIIFFSCTITLNQPDDEVTEVFKIEYQLNGGVWKDGFTATTAYTKEVEVILPGNSRLIMPFK